MEALAGLERVVTCPQVPPRPTFCEATAVNHFSIIPSKDAFRRVTGSDMGALRDQTAVNIRERVGRRKQKPIAGTHWSFRRLLPPSLAKQQGHDE